MRGDKKSPFSGGTSDIGESEAVCRKGAGKPCSLQEGGRKAMQSAGRVAESEAEFAGRVAESEAEFRGRCRKATLAV